MANAQGLPGMESYLIMPEGLYGFTAPKGQLEQAGPVLQTILMSVRPTLKWHAYINNISQLRKQADINDAQ